MFKREARDWTQYRQLKPLEVDFHIGPQDMAYYELMEEVYQRGVEALKKAHEEGTPYVLFTHGWTTSHMGKTTSRAQIRKLMKSKDATPYIIRKECIQHYSVFVAAIRPKATAP